MKTKAVFLYAASQLVTQAIAVAFRTDGAPTRQPDDEGNVFFEPTIGALYSELIQAGYTVEAVTLNPDGSYNVGSRARNATESLVLVEDGAVRYGSDGTGVSQGGFIPSAKPVTFRDQQPVLTPFTVTIQIEAFEPEDIQDVIVGVRGKNFLIDPRNVSVTRARPERRGPRKPTEPSPQLEIPFWDASANAEDPSSVTKEQALIMAPEVISGQTPEEPVAIDETPLSENSTVSTGKPKRSHRRKS